MGRSGSWRVIDITEIASRILDARLRIDQREVLPVGTPVQFAAHAGHRPGQVPGHVHR